MDSKEAYSNLAKLSRRVELLSGINSLLDWDQETYMPRKGAPLRAEQLEALATIIHQAKTSEEMANAIQSLIDIDSGKIRANNLSEEQQAALLRWRKDYKTESALPAWFVAEFAKLTSHGMEAWKEARAKDDFNIFAPYLETIIEMNRRKAEFLGFKETPYDALLDLYEPEMTTAETTRLFNLIRQPLVNLLKKITAKPQVDTKALHGHVDENTQLHFSKKILDAMKYDFASGNLSKSTHPFCSSLGPHDCRITTRIHTDNFMDNVKTVMHEAGHALYALQLPEHHFGTPLGQALSMGVHESQSRWWECLIGLSRPFWEHFLPVAQKEIGGQLNHIDLDTFWKAINKVEPSFIRVEADEVTYPLHVILRFEMEQDLIAGKLAVKEIPEAWNAKMKELLGITPPNNAKGCLQDVHWSMGAFGYFPTYLLGNAYAAFMMEAFKREYPDWEKQIAQGELAFINNWLKHNVHQHGRRYNSLPLMEEVGKTAFSTKPYIHYLTEKYSQVYGIGT